MIPSKIESKMPDEQQKSPQWNWTTKLLIGLTLVGLSIWLLIQFQDFLGPLISAFLLAYLMYPIATFFKEKLNIRWRLSVTLIYLILVVSVLGLATWGGLALFEQIQTLIRFIEKNIDQLPGLVSDIFSQTYQIGPFTLNPIGFDWNEITNEIVRAIQPLLGSVGGFASSIATGAASIVSLSILIILVSYFLLAETEGASSGLINLKIPGYVYDFNRMSEELNRIWNAFIRGELIVVVFSFAIYIVTLGILGVQFFFGLALIAAIGQLIPYLGASLTWISFGLVALFQTNIPFGLSPGVYMLIVLAVSMVMNNIIDNILRTRVMSDSLSVHPALVLIGALVGVQMFGFVGIVIAAPIMASMKLFLNYIVKKLSDQYPWDEEVEKDPPEKQRWIETLKTQYRRFAAWVKKTAGQIRQKIEKLIAERQETKGEGSNPVDDKPTGNNGR